MRAAPRAASAWVSEARLGQTWLPGAAFAEPLLGLNGPGFWSSRRPPACAWLQSHHVATPAAQPTPPSKRFYDMLERLVHKADFERLLAARSRLRSAHFAMHHVAGGPSTTEKPPSRRLGSELSTAPVGKLVQPVDISAFLQADGLMDGHWLGCVVPKRHARRAVTRSLIKRQMRSVFEKHAHTLPAGLWLLRLSGVFPISAFVSARSSALTAAVRAELEGLMLNLLRRPPVATPPVGAHTLPATALQTGSGAC